MAVSFRNGEVVGCIIPHDDGCYLSRDNHQYKVLTSSGNYYCSPAVLPNMVVKVGTQMVINTRSSVCERFAGRLGPMAVDHEALLDPFTSTQMDTGDTYNGETVDESDADDYLMVRLNVPNASSDASDTSQGMLWVTVEIRSINIISLAQIESFYVSAADVQLIGDSHGSRCRRFVYMGA